MGKLKTCVYESLGKIFSWYERMIYEKDTLAYEYRPDSGSLIFKNCPIRNIGNIYTVASLSNFFNDKRFKSLIEASIAHWESKLIFKDNRCYFDSQKLKEIASIAHNAMMILSMVEYYRNLESQDEKDRYDQTIRALARGIINQQRASGSYKIYFSREGDQGFELYAPEAMLALMSAYEHSKDVSFLKSVENAFPYYERCFSQEMIDEDILIFFANWQTQAAAKLFKHSSKLREIAFEHSLDLHNMIIHDRRYYYQLKKTPHLQATVEAACALEGLADAYLMLLSVLKDQKKADVEELQLEKSDFKEALIEVVKFLLLVQESQTDPKAKGGFGHTLTLKTQRLDVTGHVASGFLKLMQICEIDSTLAQYEI